VSGQTQASDVTEGAGQRGYGVFVQVLRRSVPWRRSRRVRRFSNVPFACTSPRQWPHEAWLLRREALRSLRPSSAPPSPQGGINGWVRSGICGGTSLSFPGHTCCPSFDSIETKLSMLRLGLSREEPGLTLCFRH